MTIWYFLIALLALALVLDGAKLVISYDCEKEKKWSVTCTPPSKDRLVARIWRKLRGR